jgi:integrase
MASVRKRTWTTGGKVKTAWVVDYFDQHGRRRLKTFLITHFAQPLL